MFNLERATNSKALETLSNSYNLGWKGNYTMYKLINLWFYKCRKNKNKVIVRGYYAYLTSTGSIGYWNAIFIYNVKKNKYSYVVGSGNYADSSYNGLKESDLRKLDIYYFNPNIAPVNFVLERLAQSTVC